MEVEFLDFSSKAKELGISEARLRAKILSKGRPISFAFFKAMEVHGTQDSFLPARAEEEFPHVWWTDYGSSFERGGLTPVGNEAGRPRYQISGWMALGSAVVDTILTAGATEGHSVWAAVVTVGIDNPCWFNVSLPKKKDWIEAKEYYDGGYGVEVTIPLTRDDLHFLPEYLVAPATVSETNNKPLASRERNNLLRIIRALVEMHGLPPKGYAESLRAQLDMLGITAPSDDTIRKVIEDARALNS